MAKSMNPSTISITNPRVYRQSFGAGNPLFAFDIHVPHRLYVEALQQQGYDASFIANQFNKPSRERNGKFEFDCDRLERDMRDNLRQRLRGLSQEATMGFISDSEGTTLCLFCEPGMAGKLADMFARAKHPVTYEDRLNKELVALAEQAIPSPARLASHIKSFNTLRIIIEKSILDGLKLDAEALVKSYREVN